MADNLTSANVNQVDSFNIPLNLFPRSSSEGLNFGTTDSTGRSFSQGGSTGSSLSNANSFADSSNMAQSAGTSFSAGGSTGESGNYSQSGGQSNAAGGSTGYSTNSSQSSGLSNAAGGSTGQSTGYGTSAGTSQQQGANWGGINWGSPVASALQGIMVNQGTALPGVANNLASNVGAQYENILNQNLGPAMQAAMNSLAARNMVNSSVGSDTMAQVGRALSQDAADKSFQALINQEMAKLQVPGQLSNIISQLGAEQMGSTSGTSQQQALNTSQSSQDAWNWANSVQDALAQGYSQQDAWNYANSVQDAMSRGYSTQDAWNQGGSDNWANSMGQSTSGSQSNAQSQQDAYNWAANAQDTTSMNVGLNESITENPLAPYQLWADVLLAQM